MTPRLDALIHRGRRSIVGLVVAAGLGGPALAMRTQDGDDLPPSPQEAGQERPDLLPRTGSRWLSELERFLEEVEAESPTRKVEPITLSPSTITVLKGEDLRRSGARFVSDALRLLPGLEVTRANSTDSNVSVRSFGGVSSSSQGILTLVDGYQVYNDFFGNTLWDGLAVSMFDLQRIEVNRGPGSFLHGPNAMHGLIDFKTRSPLDDFDQDTVSFDLGGGSYDSRQATLIDVRKKDRTALKTTLSWDDINRFDDRDANAKDKRFLELRLEHEPAEEHRLELTGGLLEHDMDLFLPQVLVIPPAEMATDIRESYLRGRWTHGGWRVSASYRNFHSSSLPDRFYPAFDVELETVDLDLQYGFKVGDRHELMTGSGTRRSWFRTRNQDVAMGSHAADLGWLFLEDRIQLSEDLFLTAGLRVDRHSKTGTSLSPRVAAVWQLRERESLRASFGTGFRNPSLRELWFNMPIMVPGLPTITIAGNDDLDPERMRSFELGYRRQSTEDEGQGMVNAGATLFYNLVDDLIEFSAVGTQALPTNQVDQAVYGAELDAEYLFTDSLAGFTNLSYGIRRMRDGNDRLESVPRYKANLGVRYALREHTAAMLWLNHFGATRIKTSVNGALLAVEDVSDYTLLNGRISRKVDLGNTEGTLYLQAYNLLDRDHREHAGAQSLGQVVMVGFSLHW